MSFLDWFRKKDKVLRKAYSIISSDSTGQVKWSDKNYENFAKEAYIKNVVAYRCIYEIAKSGVQVDWGIYRKKNGKKEKVTDTPYDHLIERPNHDDSFGFLMMQTLCFDGVAGNSYLQQIRPLTGIDRTPLELHVMRPDRMSVICDDSGQIIAYLYKRTATDKKRFDVDRITGDCDILHMKQFHPTDDLYGLSPVEPAAYSIDTNNEAVRWNMKILQNEARIGLIYLFNGILGNEDYDQVESNIKKFTGSDNAGKSLILQSENGVEVKPYAWSPKEIDFIEGYRQTARAVCFAFGYPSQLMGIPGDSTYSNVQEARKALWEETNLFKLNYLKGELNNWLFKEDTEGLMIDYSTENVAALAEKRTMLWKRAEESTFLTINEKREMVGKDPIQGGDVLFVPANLIPLGEEVPEEPNNPGNQLDIDDDKAKEFMGLT